MLRTITQAIRGLVRRPTYSITAVAALAVGIGATTAIFSAVNATVLRPLPYANPEDLYVLTSRLVDGRWTSGRVAGAYVAAADGAPSVVDAVPLADGEGVVITDEGRNRQVLVQSVGEGFFDLFGVEMAQGRSFRPEDYAPSSSAQTFSEFPQTQAIISDRLWSVVFGRDPAAVGQSLRMATATISILGVAPPEFDVPTGTDVWVATPFGPNGTAHTLEAFLRTTPGTTLERLEEELDAAMLGVIEQRPETATGRDLVATSLTEVILGDLGTILVVLLVGSGLLLLLSCANVATLLLARGVTRTKELAVSSAHGASRLRIAGHFVSEAFVLSVLGTLLGFGLAAAGLRALLASGAADLPRMSAIPFDAGVLAFSAAVLVGVTLVVGFLPAFRLSEPNLRGLLAETQGASGGRGARRALTGLVVVDVALAVAILSSAGWLARSYQALADTDPGFVAEGRLVIEALLAGSKYAPMPEVVMSPEGFPMIDPEWIPTGTPEAWIEQLSERLTGSGRVAAVGAAQTMPFDTDWDTGYYVATSEQDFDPDRQEVLQLRPVTLGFFEAMGMRVLAGRTFAPGDEGDVAVVNEEFVRRYMTGRDPVGASFFWGFPRVNFERPVPIVGVVSDVRYTSLAEAAGPVFYVLSPPVRQNVIVATNSDDPMALAPGIIAAAAEMDPSIPLEVQSLEAVVNGELLLYRLGLILMVTFAAISLVMTAIGIYGVVAHSSNQRTRELAVRTTLGATPRGVANLILAEGRSVALGGVAIGVAGAYAVGRVVSSRLYGVNPEDPLVLGGAAASVLAITVLVYLVPALRAAQLRPAASLKAE
jgi:hypothetical protein